MLWPSNICREADGGRHGQFRGSSSASPALVPVDVGTHVPRSILRGTGVIISCAQPDSYWFMTRPKAKLNFPLVIYASWLFSVFSRVWKPPSRIAYRRAASRYLDLLVSSHRTMSFKCRVRVFEGKRFQSRDVTEWKNRRNELYE